ncbi:FtsK/SpoIIIE domain-containing protein [Microbacterium sp. 2MCAF23]|uniref:FtsK/SpoIIIE domain-containing protein n=1 Tax=Microbacterium sp. 2MCAF23 TaxID=3232985 RepID=UPI003F94AB1B
MDPAETIVLPAVAAAPQRDSLPLLAAAVPVVSGIVLFAVTGSPLSLCFAALGPVMILGSFLDSVRQRRRAARVARAEETQAWSRVEQIVSDRESEERARRLRAVPDIAACLVDPPTRPIALADTVEIAAGRGDGPSPLRFSGTGGRAEAFRVQHSAVTGVPVLVRLSDGVCVRGPAPIAAAVARAMVLQLCLRHANGAVRLEGDAVAALGLDGLPQARLARQDAGVVHLGVQRSAPSGPRLCLLQPGTPPPVGYHAVLDVTEPASARLRTPQGTQDCTAEGISREQAEAIVQVLIREQDDEAAIPAAVALQEVLPPLPGQWDTGIVGPESVACEGLRAAIGRDAEGAVVPDLVADGPHALVTGVTGAGKSELLVSWVAALAATHSAEQVSFVLADFKGGTAFEPLRALPHVAAVITDLDADGAERGVRSLRAELRRREGVLAETGARSVAETGGVLGRLVIVVDEFAALLQEHPDLAAVFTDIAARGRALGMHLILGTQRATGVIRDALAANCPLRIALRVTDPADSRIMIGSDAAAALPGDLAGRGLAYVRRPQDAAPAVFRVARTSADELATIAAHWRGVPRARSPWQAALPAQLQRADLPAAAPGEITLGLADEPEQQRQTVRTLRIGEDRGLVVFGGPGAGKSSVLRAAVAQVPGGVLLRPDPEQAWSLIDEIADGGRPVPPLLAVDDVDRHLAAFPLEYASAWVERLQRVVRLAAEHGGTVLLSASRCSGQISAVADLLPERALLRTVSRTEHLTAGGEPGTFDPDRPPGRARLGGAEVQFVLPEAEAEAGAPGSSPLERTAAHPETPQWEPRAMLVGVVSTAPARTAERLGGRFGRAAVQVLVDGAPVILPDGAGRFDESAAPARIRADDAIARSAERAASAEREAAGLIVLVGDGEAWQRQYALWQRIVRGGEVVVLAEATRELRMLTGVRELPPYAVPHAGRAWTIDRDGRPSRVILPTPRGDVSPAARPAA